MRGLSIAVVCGVLSVAGCQSDVPTYMQPKIYPGHSQAEIDRCQIASFKEIPQAVGSFQMNDPNLVTGAPSGRIVPVDMNRGLRERYMDRCLAKKYNRLQPPK